MGRVRAEEIRRIIEDNMNGNWIPKILHLPGTKLTPEVVLHRTLTKLPHIKSVCIVIQWDDDSFDVDWSAQLFRLDYQ